MRRSLRWREWECREWTGKSVDELLEKFGPKFRFRLPTSVPDSKLRRGSAGWPRGGISLGCFRRLLLEVNWSSESESTSIVARRARNLPSGWMGMSVPLIVVLLEVDAIECCRRAGGGGCSSGIMTIVPSVFVSLQAQEIIRFVSLPVYPHLTFYFACSLMA
ncbi:hypothetical protein M3Y99_01904000 [Aphelenchoides fujianensis]|nr:hypothetical protein M3Y99_01904000 [Aphelenchoides fujianensis]